MFYKKINNYCFVAPSNTQYKKYDVFDCRTHKKLASFGDIRYQQYHDKIGYYKELDHLDNIRRKNYRNRHRNDNLDRPSAGYFSYYYLW